MVDRYILKTLNRTFSALNCLFLLAFKKIKMFQQFNQKFQCIRIFLKILNFNFYRSIFIETLKVN
jgi:hypothetical protein